MVLGCFSDKYWCKCLLQYLKNWVDCWCVINWTFQKFLPNWKSWKNSPATKEKMLSISYPKNIQHFPSIHCQPLAERLYFQTPSGKQEKSPLLYYIFISLLSTFKQNCLCWPKIKDKNWGQPGKATSILFMLFLKTFKALDLQRQKPLPYCRRLKIVFPIMKMNRRQDWRCWKVHCSEYLAKCTVTAHL